MGLEYGGSASSEQLAEYSISRRTEETHVSTKCRFNPMSVLRHESIQIIKQNINVIYRELLVISSEGSLSRNRRFLQRPTASYWGTEFSTCRFK